MVKLAPCLRVMAMLGVMLGVVSDGYFFGVVCDDGTKRKEDFFGLSYPGLVVGFTLAVMVAAGSAYSHMKLNKHLQTKSSDDSASINGDDHHQSDDDIKLFWYQWIALLGNSIAEAADVVAPTAFTVKLGMHNQPLSKEDEGIFNAGLFVFGLICAAADTMSCRLAMLALNRAEKHRSNEIAAISEPFLGRSSPQPSTDAASASPRSEEDENKQHTIITINSSAS